MEKSYERFLEQLQGNGLAAKITTLEHIDDLKNEIIGLKNKQLLSDQFYNDNLSWIDFNYKNTMPDARSILVIACPQFITRLNFRYNDKDYPVKIPPTYVYSEVCGKVEKILETVLWPYNYSFKKTKLPAKLLAVSTGLGMYGRNNVCYVEGMGSFHRLFSYYTDIPCGSGSWEGKTVMPECKSCSACLNACPTGSINKNRFLIDAEKCITNFNEKEGDFPSWIDNKWHNALVGCLKCQGICPKNRNFIDKTENEAEFDSEETASILEKVPFEKLPENLKMKLDKLDLTEYYTVLCRNLSCLIK